MSKYHGKGTSDGFVQKQIFHHLSDIDTVINEWPISLLDASSKFKVYTDPKSEVRER